MGHPQRLAQQGRPHDNTLKGQGIVKDHSAAGAQDPDGFVPGPITDNGRDDTDVNDGGDSLQPQVNGNMLQFKHSRRRNQGQADEV